MQIMTNHLIKLAFSQLDLTPELWLALKIRLFFLTFSSSFFLVAILRYPTNEPFPLPNTTEVLVGGWFSEKVAPLDRVSFCWLAALLLAVVALLNIYKTNSIHSYIRSSLRPFFSVSKS